MEKELLSPSDLSTALGLTTGRVYQMLAAGEIPCIRVGRAVRIPRQVWRDWLDAQTAKAKSGAAR